MIRSDVLAMINSVVCQQWEYDIDDDKVNDVGDTILCISAAPEKIEKIILSYLIGTFTKQNMRVFDDFEKTKVKILNQSTICKKIWIRTL